MLRAAALLLLALGGCRRSGGGGPAGAAPFTPGPDGVWVEAVVVDTAPGFRSSFHVPPPHVLVRARVTNRGARTLLLYTTGTGPDGYQFGPMGAEPGWFAFVVGRDTLALASWYVGTGDMPATLAVLPGATEEVTVATPGPPWPPPSPGPPPGTPLDAYVPSDSEEAAHRRADEAYEVALDTATAVPRLRRIAEGAELIYVERTGKPLDGLPADRATRGARVRTVLRLGRGAVGRAAYERWPPGPQRVPFPPDA